MDFVQVFQLMNLNFLKQILVNGDGNSLFRVQKQSGHSE